MTLTGGGLNSYNTTQQGHAYMFLCPALLTICPPDRDREMTPTSIHKDKIHQHYIYPCYIWICIVGRMLQSENSSQHSLVSLIFPNAFLSYNSRRGCYQIKVWTLVIITFVFFSFTPFIHRFQPTAGGRVHQSPWRRKPLVILSALWRGLA